VHIRISAAATPRGPTGRILGTRSGLRSGDVAGGAPADHGMLLWGLRNISLRQIVYSLNSCLYERLQ
jgi:hypothetical protein